jgi:hypothetical protein
MNTKINLFPQLHPSFDAIRHPIFTDKLISEFAVLSRAGTTIAKPPG